MTKLNQGWWVTGILFGLAGAIGCSAAESRAGDGAHGRARVAMTEAPEEVRCAVVTAAGSSVSRAAFDVSPGDSSVFELNGLPFGAVAFSAEAFPAACADVAAAATPSWLAASVDATLVPGVVADVALTLQRNGRAAVSVEFAAEGTCANGVQDGTESGVDCGGECLPCSGEPAPSETSPVRPLLFSEYVEGSSTYKALEIAALEATSLDGCELAVYVNGATSATRTALAGTLLGGETHVLCSSSLVELGGSCDQTANLTFNGDDAIALECDGALVDVIGQIGFDPGTAWGSGDLALLDHTLRRRCEVAQGDTDGSDGFEPAEEWSGHALDSFEDLGLRVCP